MSILRDVQFISQLRYNTHVAVIENFTFMTNILNVVAHFHFYLEKVVNISCISRDYSFIPSMLRMCASNKVMHN